MSVRVQAVAEEYLRAGVSLEGCPVSRKAREELSGFLADKAEQCTLYINSRQAQSGTCNRALDLVISRSI